jgi:hypothetical protein
MATVCVLASCGGAGGGEVDLPGLGFSMQLPAGWRVDEPSDDGAVFSASSLEDSVGSVFLLPAEGITLSEYVRRYSPTATTTTPGAVSGLEAVEVVETGEARTCITSYIRRGEDVIVVTLGTLPEDFPGAEQSLRDALASMEIR